MRTQSYRCTCQVCGGSFTVRVADGIPGLMRELSAELVCTASPAYHHAILGLHRIVDIELLDTTDKICYPPRTQNAGAPNGIH